MKHPMCWIRPRSGINTVLIPNGNGNPETPPSGSGDAGVHSDLSLCVGTMDSSLELAGEMLAEAGARRNPEYRVDAARTYFTSVFDGDPILSDDQEVEKPDRGDWEANSEKEADQQAEEERLIGNADPSRLPPP